MTTSSSGSGAPSIQELTAQEIALIKMPLLAFAAALQQPGANILSIQTAGTTLLLVGASLGPQALTILINFVGAALAAKINSIS